MNKQNFNNSQIPASKLIDMSIYFRNLGFGKQSMEQMIVEEVQELCSGLEATGGNAIDIRNKLLQNTNFIEKLKSEK